MHDFQQKLAFSLGDRERFDMDALKRAISGCVSVEKTDVETDKSGIDYIATLRNGAEIYIDAKARELGASKYWKHGEPDCALEIYSVMKCKNVPDGKVGWTLNEASNVDLILYTFDPEDSRMFYLIPFQQLRMAMRKNWDVWKNEYKPKIQKNDGWNSMAIFVPASVLIRAVTDEMSFSVA